MNGFAEGAPQHGQESLEALLAPRSIALVGASARPDSAGLALVEMLRCDGYSGRIYPVNPRYGEIAGLACYSSIPELPEVPEHAVLAVPNAGLEAALDQAIALGVRAATIFASCHLDDGCASPLAKRLATRAAAAGMALCGGNCMGFYNRRDGLRVASFISPPGLRRGGVVWIAQSGSAFSALTHNDRRLGFLLAVSSGMELVTDASQYMQWALAQTETRVIGLFLETVRDPRGFEEALAEAARRAVPVVVLKVGRTARSAAMALTHTGALAGDDAAYAALLRRHGAIQVDDLDEMAAVLALLDTSKLVGPGALASMHDSGGERELMVDLAEANNVPLADISSRTRTIIARNLDPGLEPDNPLDAWGTDRDYVARYTACLSALLEDPSVAMGLFFSDVRDNYWYSAGIVDAVAAAAAASSKPVAIASNYALTLDRGIALDAAARGVPILKGTRATLKAVRAIFEHRDRLSRPADPAPVAPEDAVIRWRARLAEGGRPGEAEALEMLRDFGIATPRVAEISDAAGVQIAASRLTPPFALKTAEDHAHKSDVGGVVLGLPDAAAADAAWRDFADRLGPRAILAEMASPGVEIGIGARVDPAFGALVVVSAGGTLIEVIADRAIALAPFGPAEAAALLSRLRVSALLHGARGAPKANIAALGRTIALFSSMVAALAPVLEEIDVNPVIVSPSGTVAVDCLVIPAQPMRK